MNTESLHKNGTYYMYTYQPTLPKKHIQTYLYYIQFIRTRILGVKGKMYKYLMMSVLISVYAKKSINMYVCKYRPPSCNVALKFKVFNIFG